MRALRVLLCDPHPAFRSAASYYLTTTGKLDVVASVADEEEALEKARELHPDLVLVELSPPLQHYQLLFTRLKAVDPAPRVVAMTSLDDLDDRTLDGAVPADGRLKKSTFCEDLAPLLQRLFP